MAVLSSSCEKHCCLRNVAVWAEEGHAIYLLLEGCSLMRDYGCAAEMLT